MIGLVIVTHGRLAEEFVSAMEHVVGPQRLVEAVCIGPDDNMENRRQDIIKAVAAAEMGDGVIVLTDMFGGTPSNLAISILEEANIEVLLPGDDGAVGSLITGFLRILPGGCRRAWR